MAVNVNSPILSKYQALGFDSGPDFSNMLALVTGNAPAKTPTCAEQCAGKPNWCFGIGCETKGSCLQKCGGGAVSPDPLANLVQKYLEPFRSLIVVVVLVVLLFVAVNLIGG